MRCPVSVYVKPGTNMACAKASQLRGGVWAIARCESAGIALRHRYAMSRTDVAYEDQKVPDSDVSLSGSVQQKAVRRLGMLVPGLGWRYPLSPGRLLQEHSYDASKPVYMRPYAIGTQCPVRVTDAA
eukprot:2432479-Rhodomonas_salina.1